MLRSPADQQAPWVAAGPSRRSASRRSPACGRTSGSAPGRACRRRPGCRSSGPRPRRPGRDAAGVALAAGVQGAASSIGRREAMATPCQPFWPRDLQVRQAHGHEGVARELALLALDLLQAQDVDVSPRSTKRATWSMRRRTELMFQVAMRSIGSALLATRQASRRSFRAQAASDRIASGSGPAP